GKSLIDKFNWRITKIPRHPGLKIFLGGLQSIARLTANEYRDLMK
ncbi:2862_t:CDS:1, partial [Diversispora eburnea]